MHEIPAIVRERVLQLIHRHGESETARRLGLSRYSTVRLAGGMRVTRGTLTVAAVALGIDLASVGLAPRAA